MINKLYSTVRPFLFQLDPEKAHHFTLNTLQIAERWGISNLLPQPQQQAPVPVMGLSFPNLVGLAAGLDKNGEYIDALATLGFGFIEVGTVTLRPQTGNPLPRMFRLPEAEAIINRMGFNNNGVEQLIKNLEATQYKGILGINIGKNADTPMEQAVEDYLVCLERVYPYASYVTINISSPNTKNLRDLQQADHLKELLSSLKEVQTRLTSIHGKYVPLAVKIAPDLDHDALNVIADLLYEFQIDAVIATNTTISRDLVQGLPFANETGGLSGIPVRERSTAVIRELAVRLKDEIPIIGVGGICSANDAVEKIQAGASLVQLYTGLIYRGPGLVAETVNALQQ